MFSPLPAGFVLLLVSLVQAAYDNNLVYQSIVHGNPEFGMNTTEIHARFSKRDLVPSGTYKDEHYPYYVGGNYQNDPSVWTNGVSFTHSVASGDPWDTSVILWTRAVPANTNGANVDVPLCVSWQVSTDGFTSQNYVSTGQAFTSSDVDWTVKVEAKYLTPDSLYQYRFTDCRDPSIVSPVGNTRTIASPDTPANMVNNGNPLKFGIFSCSNYPHGYFNAYNYAALVAKPDIYIHLGDYTYEYSGGGQSIGRHVPGEELSTLADYRKRIALYRTDQGLINAHLAAPWIAVWDDHEVADNSWRDGSTDSNNTRPAGCDFSPAHVCFNQRKSAAVQAYHEWMPIRRVNADDKWRIWRNFQIGGLLDLTMLDTRQYDRDITNIYTNKAYIASIADKQGRTIMGDKQTDWFLDTLTNSTARGALWRIIGQQVVFSSIKYSSGSESYNYDAWDGYRQNRAAILHHIKKNDIQNNIVLSGDSHANWVSDLTFPNDTKSYDSETGNGALGVEFAVTAVTSPGGFGNDVKTATKKSSSLVKRNPELQWSEGYYRGFFVLSVDSNEAIATFYSMKNVSTPNLDVIQAAQFTVKHGANSLARPVAGGNVNAGALKTTGSKTSKGKGKKGKDKVKGEGSHKPSHPKSSSAPSSTPSGNSNSAYDWASQWWKQNIPSSYRSTIANYQYNPNHDMLW